MLIHLYFDKDLLAEYDKFAKEYLKIVYAKVHNKDLDLKNFSEIFKIFMNKIIQVSETN